MLDGTCIHLLCCGLDKDCILYTSAVSNIHCWRKRSLQDPTNLNQSDLEGLQITIYQGNVTKITTAILPKNLDLQQ